MLLVVLQWLLLAGLVVVAVLLLELGLQVPPVVLLELLALLADVQQLGWHRWGARVGHNCRLAGVEARWGANGGPASCHRCCSGHGLLLQECLLLLQLPLLRLAGEVLCLQPLQPLGAS